MEASKKPFLLENKKGEKKKGGNFFLYVFIGITCALALIVGLAFLVDLAIAPCKIKTCHKNATCINSPFNPKCQCNKGFVGNGIECDECGIAYPNSKNRDNYGYGTVGYGDAHIMPAFSYPSTVLVKFYFYSLARNGNRTYNPYYTTRCLGALINRRTVITVGSCMPKSFNFTPVNIKGQRINVKADLNEFYPTYGSMYSVWIGIHKYIYLDYDISPIQLVKVKDIIWHPKFDPSSFDFDVVVVKLAESIVPSESVQFACIPTADEIQDESKYISYNASGVSLGYVYYVDSRDYWSLFLGDFDLNIFNVSNCTGHFPFTPDPDQIFCAGNYHFLPPNPPSRLNGLYCEGNPGSPFYVNRTVNGQLRTYTIGLMSNNTKCGISVFSNLFHYVDWLGQYTDY